VYHVTGLVSGMYLEENVTKRNSEISG